MKSTKYKRLLKIAVSLTSHKNSKLTITFHLSVSQETKAILKNSPLPHVKNLTTLIAVPSPSIVNASFVIKEPL